MDSNISNFGKKKNLSLPKKIEKLILVTKVKKYKTSLGGWYCIK